MARRSAAPTAKAINFFRHYASFMSISLRRRPRKEAAKQLAWAEAEASARGWRTEWFGDPDGELEMMGAILRDEDGHPLTQRWGIQDPSRPYKRVIEAELALEALQ